MIIILLILLIGLLYYICKFIKEGFSNKLYIEYPNNFYLKKDRYLFNDVFISGSNIICVSMVYPDIKINFDKIEIIYLDKKSNFTKINTHRVYESSVICILEDPALNSHFRNNNTIDIIINYNNKSQNYILNNIHNINKYNLSFGTHFKSDYKLVKPWIEYYSKLGVEHFYLYYNDTITPEVYEFMSTLDQSKFTLVQWKYKMWLNDIGWENKKEHVALPRNTWWTHTNIKIYDKKLRGNIHHSQIMAINTIIQKYKYNSNWIGLFDLDEYIVCHNLTNLMREFNLASTVLVYFNNSWADIQNTNRDQFSVSDLKNKEIIRDLNKFKYTIRNKNILNPRNILNYGNHKPYNTVDNTKIYDSFHYFLHFYKFSPKNRTKDLIQIKTIEYQINNNLNQQKLKSITIATPSIIKNKVIYKFILNKKVYKFYIKYQKSVLFKKNIDNIVTLLLPYCIKNKYILKSKAKISNSLHNQISQLTYKLRKKYNSDDFLLINIKSNSYTHENQIIYPYTNNDLLEKTTPNIIVFINKPKIIPNNIDPSISKIYCNSNMHKVIHKILYPNYTDFQIYCLFYNIDLFLA